jgi:hypothetical protein
MSKVINIQTGETFTITATRKHQGDRQAWHTLRSDESGATISVRDVALQADYVNQADVAWTNRDLAEVVRAWVAATAYTPERTQRFHGVGVD